MHSLKHRHVTTLTLNVDFSGTIMIGDSRYQWLNDIIAVGTGEHTPEGPVYSIFEVG
jgi:Protein of unknown function (DUF3237)